VIDAYSIQPALPVQARFLLNNIYSSLQMDEAKYGVPRLVAAFVLRRKASTPKLARTR
jgi:hypothetical protein